jgi:glutathione S-transferase
MHYYSVSEAKAMPGLRLVLSAGVPGPWGEAAKAVLRARNVAFAPVGQEPMAENAELRAWTGCRNAPVAVYDDEPPLTGWFDILMLAERLGSGPSLLPETSADRVVCLGFITEICGQDGFGWNRRIDMLTGMWVQQLPADLAPHQREYIGQYGLSPDATARAPHRTADILGALARQLRAQQARGSAYLVGDRLTAVDLYWACFSQLIGPLPAALNPIPEYVLRLYSHLPDTVAAAIDPIVFEHRDHIYERHIGLPLDY